MKKTIWCLLLLVGLSPAASLGEEEHRDEHFNYEALMADQVGRFKVISDVAVPGGLLLLDSSGGESWFLHKDQKGNARWSPLPLDPAPEPPPEHPER